MGSQDQNRIVSDSPRRRGVEGRLDESCEFSRAVAPGTGEKNGLSSHYYARAQGAHCLFGPLALLYPSFPLTTPPAAFGELENDGRGYLHSVEP